MILFIAVRALWAAVIVFCAVHIVLADERAVMWLVFSTVVWVACTVVKDGLDAVRELVESLRNRDDE